LTNPAAAFPMSVSTALAGLTLLASVAVIHSLGDEMEVIVEDRKRSGWSFWRYWCRGVVRLGRLYMVLISVFLVWSLAKAAFDFATALPVPLTVGIDLVWIVLLLLLVPPLVSSLVPGPEEGEAHESERLRPLVDALAGRLGVDWGRHWLSQVDALIQEGKPDEAAQKYREQSGATWDEAHSAVGNWADNEPERKLRALIQSMQSPGAAAIPTERS
jgi:hypothetical protein